MLATLTYVAMGVLLIGPPVMAWLAVWARSKPPILLRLIVSAGVLLALVVCGAWAEVSFVQPLLNLVAIWLAYLALAFLAVALAFTPWPRWLTVPIQLVAALPILLGYLLGSFGVLILVIFLGRSLEPVQQTQPMSGGVVCRSRILQGMPDDDALLVEVFRTWPPLPLQRWIGWASTELGVESPPSCVEALKSR